MSRVRSYFPDLEVQSSVAELVLDTHAVAQITAIKELSEEDGFLVRIWPPNGTHEYGGYNMTALSFVIRFENGHPSLKYLDFSDRISE